MDRLPLDRVKWPLMALLASAAMLATAHGFEHFANLAPCHLCYVQREIYRVAGGFALAGIFARWRGASAGVMSVLCFALALSFLAEAGVASYHALVEWKVLPSPGCEFAPLKKSGDIWEQLGRPMKVPSCDEAKWRMLGLSMAGWNALVAFGLTLASLIAALRPMHTDTNNETRPAETLA
jgi:disulfide bond formation protein DsbB